MYCFSKIVRCQKLHIIKTGQHWLSSFKHKYYKFTFRCQQVTLLPNEHSHYTKDIFCGDIEIDEQRARCSG